MKINEIIRKKRMEKGYTQEQMASFLGVSAPAVNKWEKAISYPDITLLPSLARLLDTDLNTLLSFQADPTQEEIQHFLDELVSAANTDGFDRAFHMAFEKLHEYPSCDALLLNTALTLEGLVITQAGNTEFSSYMSAIEELYMRVSKSHDPAICNQAKAMMISKHIGRKEFDAAQNLLDELPDTAMFDKKQLQSTLYLQQGDWIKAAQLIEQKVLSGISMVQSALYTLTEIAVKENHLSDAEQLAGTARQVTELFDLWECNTYIVDFLLALAKEDTRKCLEALQKMLPALEKNWKPARSPLYRHLSLKDTNNSQMMRTWILNDLENPENHAYDFLRDDPAVCELLEKYR